MSNRNAFKHGRQGKQWLALWEAANGRGRDKLTESELQEIGVRAVVKLKPNTIRQNLRYAGLLEKEGLLERFAGSVYDLNQHPAYFMKLFKYRPEWCAILLERGHNPQDMTANGHGERRLKYEMLVSMADNEEHRAAVKKLRPGEGSSLAVMTGGEVKPIKTRKGFDRWLKGPDKDK